MSSPGAAAVAMAAEPLETISLAVEQSERAAAADEPEAPAPKLPTALLERRRQLIQRQSNVWTRRQQAVCVRRAYKRYGTKKQPHVVLDGLNMTVPKGVIYGLLGASGCGKTTLLNCIVGRRRLDTGEIWVLGGRPGSRGSGVPGPRIGYMPQELSLYQEFTIRETLMYFGWINNMTTKEIDKQSDFVLNFLMLPSASRIVKTLRPKSTVDWMCFSGGQIRRVSLAAALLHDPELLILDEPTVGVDPLLRQNIWDHLVNITKEGNKTVIITTHYIDETRQAHTIGLMRGGRFLAEESPADLLATHMCDSLEDVFLKLSKLQNIGKRRRSSFMQEVMSEIQADEPVAYDVNSEISGEYGDNVSLSNRDVQVSERREGDDLPPDEETDVTCMDRLKIISPHKMKALIWKNFLWLIRNVSVMLFILGIPIMQAILYCLSIGQDPKGLHVGIVNHELNSSMDTCKDENGCVLEKLSCRYLQHFRTRPIVIDHYETDEQARYAVSKGYAWASLVFESNYSESLVERISDGRSASELAVEYSDIMVLMDMSNQHIGQMLRKDMFETYFEFAADVLSACNYSAHVAGIPIRYNIPIYGDKDPNFRDFAAPGVILTIIFFFCVAQTSITMMLERNEGTLERCLVSGVTPIEILVSHIITQFVLMTVQVAAVLIITFPVFGVPCEGSFFWVTILGILTGMCGMCFGFLVSCFCDNERSATYVGLGSFLPSILICGIVWPVEGQHYILRYISFTMPLTHATESLRAIIARGWDIDTPLVYYGFIATLLWIFIYLGVSVLSLKFKKG